MISPLSLDLSGYMRLPGLINAHDHLEFNLFPRLGRGPYANATEWASDIYHPDRSPIREHLQVPKAVRLWWGALKNLLSGVTTVCHHNPYEPEVFGADFPIRVVRRFAWAHSLAFEPDVPGRIRNAPKSFPFLIHCGEGTDRVARKECQALYAMGVLDRRTAIIHGVATDRDGINRLRERGSSLVWCPTSNLRMLGRTISRTVLQSGIPIALATDSALTGAGGMLDELCVAQKYVSPARLFEMVTTAPARILRLAKSWGRKDWIAVKTSEQAPAAALISGAVALVVIDGRVRLISPALAEQLPSRARKRFQPLALEGRPTVLVDADVGALYLAASKHLGPDVRLAGRRVLA